MNRLRLASLTRRCWALALGLGASGAGTGCGSTDHVEVYPGGQTGGEQPATDGPCDAVYQELLLDEVAPFGATAASVLEPVLGTNTAPLLWSSSTGNITLGPEQGLSDVELIASYTGGRIAWAHFVPETAPEGDGAAAAPTSLLGCAADRLEIDLDVWLRTGGGALAERFVATLGAPTPDNAQFTKRFTLDALEGSFFITAPSGVSAALQITVVWDVFGFRGLIDGVVTTDPGDGTVSGQQVPFGQWPPPSAP